jgi:hypothetical protein
LDSGFGRGELPGNIFPLVLMRELAAELAARGTIFKIMAICESQIGRQIQEIEGQTFKKPGIIQ